MLSLGRRATLRLEADAQLSNELLIGGRGRVHRPELGFCSAVESRLPFGRLINSSTDFQRQGVHLLTLGICGFYRARLLTLRV